MGEKGRLVSGERGEMGGLYREEEGGEVVEEEEGGGMGIAAISRGTTA